MYFRVLFSLRFIFSACLLRFLRNIHSMKVAFAFREVVNAWLWYSARRAPLASEARYASRVLQEALTCRFGSSIKMKTKYNTTKKGNMIRFFDGERNRVRWACPSVQARKTHTRRCPKIRAPGSVFFFLTFFIFSNAELIALLFKWTHTFFIRLTSLSISYKFVCVDLTLEHKSITFYNTHHIPLSVHYFTV